MKTLELDLKKKVLIVQPEETGNMNYWVTLHSKDWDFICKGSELTEEIASELVDYWQNMANDGFIFENYKDNIPKKLITKESFISAVESKGFHWLENPYGKEPECYATPYTDIYTIQKRANRHKQWQEAEEKTFRNPLIFVKNA